MNLANNLKEGNWGDAVEQVTSATGIKAAVEFYSSMTGKDCGCDARKEKLNNFGNKVMN